MFSARFALACIAIGWAPAPVAAQSAANERAYTLTLMCAVVAGHYRSGDDVPRTMAALRKMQRAIGYNDKRLSSDMVQMSNALGAEMRKDAASMTRNREICRRLKLMR